MDPLKLLHVLRARYKVALAVVVLTLGGALAANQLLPKRYVAEAVDFFLAGCGYTEDARQPPGATR